MHESVLLNETIESLNLKDNSIVVDMTLGFAGHSSQILKELKMGIYSPLTKTRKHLLLVKKNFLK